MELFEEIRREYEFGVGTIKLRGGAFKLGVHRRMVREAVASALPPPRKKPARRRAKLAPAVGFIDRISKRTARRRVSSVTRRTLEPDTGGNQLRSGRAHGAAVRSRAQARVGIGEARDVRYDWGQEAQVDWYESWAEMDGEREAASVHDALDGERRGLSSRLSARDAAGVSGSARAGLGLLWRGVSDIEVR